MALVSFTNVVKNCIEDGLTEENIRLIVSDLENSRAEFLDFIRCIGPGLVDDDKSVRLNSTKLLSDVVSKLKASFFNHNEVEVLLEFLCAKFTDHHLIAPSSLKGLVALSQAEALSPAMVKFVIRSIFKDLTVQSLLFNERSLVYSVFDFFLKNRLQDLMDMNGEFVVGFVQLVDSERDPRNLLIIFEMICTIVGNISLGAMVQELFEFLSEYFPVEFSPAPGYDWKITREDLSKALKACFVSSPQFADYALPLLIEKMSSDFLTSKLDSMDYLIACCEVYHPDKIAEFADRIWAAIRHNIYSAEADLETNCLLALVAMTKNMSGSEDDGNPNSNLTQFMDSIFKDCSRYLQETTLPLFPESIKILLVVSCASVQSSKYLFGRIVDELMREFDIQRQAAPRVQIIKSLLIFIDSKKVPQAKGVRERLTNEHEQRCDAKVLEEILKERKDRILNIITGIGGNQSPELKSLSLWGSVNLISLDCYSEEEKLSISKHIVDLSIEATDEGVRNSVLGSLESLSVLRNDLCLEFVLPKLLSALSSELEKESGCDVGKLEHLVSAVAHISQGKELVSRVVPELLKVVSNQCQRNRGLQIISACIDGLVHLVKLNLGGGAMEYLDSRFLFDCRDSLLRLNCRVPFEASNDELERAIDGFVACIRMVVESSDVESILKFVEEVTSLFLENVEKQNIEDVEKPFLKKILHLVLASVCSVKDQEQLKDVDDVTRLCFSVARTSRDLQTCTIASKCFAALINKTSQASFLDELLKEVEDSLLELLCMRFEELTEDQRKSCILWSWMTKALVARNHPRQMIFSNQMVDMLSVPELSQLSSEGFKVVLCDFEDALSQKTNSNVTLMYKQRFFSMTINRLIDAFHLSQQELKKNFLKALSYMNQFVPMQVVHQELKSILPLLVLSLGKESTPESWVPSLSVLQYFISSSPDETGKYLDDFLPRLLEISRYPEKMTIRLEALKCLILLPEHFPSILLLPRQKQVISKLVESLSDHKRLVRQQAGIANCAWHLISEPQEMYEDEQ